MKWRWDLMTKYCPDCGKNVDETHKFCHECGKNLRVKMFYCPECGKIMTSPEKPVQPEQPKKVKPHKIRLKSPIKFGKKTVLIILAIVCIVVIASAIVVINPFKAPPVVSQRSFIITLTNDCDSNVDCSISYSVPNGQLQYGEPVRITSNTTVPITIFERDFFSTQSTYNFTVYAELDYRVGATAYNVTSAADFRIFMDDDGLHVNNTATV
jgi:hypothetical protein